MGEDNVEIAISSYLYQKIRRKRLNSHINIIEER